MSEPIDLTDERTITTKLGGKPVFLTPQPDGTIAVTEHPGREPRFVPMSELAVELSGEDPVAARDDLSDDELLAAWQTWRTGDAPAPAEQEEEGAASLSDAADEGDPAADLSDDEVYAAWKQDATEQGYDLAETDAAPVLEVGQAVEWGSGLGTGHGILMELETAMGEALVHTCEVVTAGGAGPQLSPTGKTIKVDAGKLRRSALGVVGDEKVGPELSADLSDGDPDTGNESDDSFYRRVMKQLRRSGGGFGAE